MASVLQEQIFRLYATGNTRSSKTTSSIIKLDNKRIVFFQLNEMDMMLALDPCSTDNMMMIDEDYMGLMSDTLFSTIANQTYVFPDSREIGTVILFF